MRSSVRNVRMMGRSLGSVESGCMLMEDGIQCRDVVSVSRCFFRMTRSRLLTLTSGARLGLDRDLVSVSNVLRRSPDVF
jgi:hypothetical protein